MRINFRQGLVSSKVSALGVPDFLTTNPQGVTIHGAETPLILTVSDGPKNYTIAINSSYVAWATSLFSGISEGWLYVDINRASANLTYGVVTQEPSYGPVAPTNPQNGALWFNTTRYENNIFNSSNGRWTPTLRVIVAHYTTTSLTEVAFGSQVGLTGPSVTSGRIVSDGFGRAIIDSSGRFMTTEDVVLIAGVESHAAKLESNVITGTAAESIPAFHVVRFNDVGAIALADYDDVGDSVIGLSTVSGTIGNPINIVLSGLVYNPAWTWSGPNLTLWVNQTGQLTSTDPFLAGGRLKARVPVGRTIDAHTVIFDQGMGGVGEKGDDGSVDGLPLASDVELGITLLSVPPVDPTQPIAVGDNDPRLTDPRVPLEHTHPATAVTVSPFGTFNGQNAQQALEHIQTVKLNLSGGTVTGAITSTVLATQDDHLVTLGQAKNEITARAVTQKRYTLNDTLPTIVQAFNSLSPTDRTLAVNTVIVVEYRGNVYMWAGGYGAPVSATDSTQFLLLGKLTTTASLTITAINAVTTYETATTATLVAISRDVVGSSYTINCETGEIAVVDALPTNVDVHAMHEATGMLAYVTPVNDDYLEFTVNLTAITATGHQIIKSITEYKPGFNFTGIKRISFSNDGSHISVEHQGIESDYVYVAVFTTADLEPVLHIDPVDDYTSVITGGSSSALNKDGTLLAVRHGASTQTGDYKLSVYRLDGTVVREYDEYAMSSTICFSEDSDGNETLVMATVDFNRNMDTMIYALPVAELPPTLPQAPLTALPPGVDLIQVAGVHLSEDGEQLMYIHEFNNATFVYTWRLLNISTGHMAAISLPDETNFPHVLCITGTTDGKELYIVTLPDDGTVAQLNKIDPTTHSYGPAVEFNIPDTYVNEPFLI